MSFYGTPLHKMCLKKKSKPNEIYCKKQPFGTRYFFRIFSVILSLWCFCSLILNLQQWFAGDRNNGGDNNSDSNW